jgi:hypothetical protein
MFDAIFDEWLIYSVYSQIRVLIDHFGYTLKFHCQPVRNFPGYAYNHGTDLFQKAALGATLSGRTEI